ncbi:2'-5' RNA ligase family protein [Eubacterium multiforme]|uniref:2'-5' RNA ligase n=1 Tax=Eubacterium multiforme TaxID=83339 RepID=A0ABT9UNT4_9FIRM|nr:2'-5' RNA ligase family protein [Eubacterium multiforme]MDQ0148301.1 2'-5' RNA ligase [Eubacterium multiforme]
MYVVDIFLDRKASRYVESIWKALSDNGIDSSLSNMEGLSPHITLAIYDDIDKDKFIAKMKEFKSKINVIDTKFDVLGVFPTTGACITTPVVTEELLALHRKYYDYFKEFNSNARAYYLPDNWNPHCSLAMGLDKEKLMDAFKFILNMYEPFEASLEGIALYEIEMENGKFTDSIRLF